MIFYTLVVKCTGPGTLRQAIKHENKMIKNNL